MFRAPLHLVLLVAVAAAPGCGVDCGAPTQVNGTYAMFANVITYDGTHLEDFPSEMSPANGPSEWLIAFDAISGQTTVAIDGQAYDAGGSWNTEECGRFNLQFGGLYLSAAHTTHLFQATGDFLGYNGHIEGTWTYSEDWSDGNGHDGTFHTEGQLSGDRIDGGS